MSIFEKPPLDELMHYGMPRRSGRYPWGSGEDPYQHESMDFLSRIDTLKKEGWTETPENIKKEFGMTTTEYRKEKSLANDERKLYQVAQIKTMREDGKGWTEIGNRLGLPESTVRSMLNEKSQERNNQAKNTAKFLKEQIDSRGMIDVAAGTELELNISKETLNKALKILEEEGYPTYNGRFEQATNKGNWTTQKVVCPPGTEHKEIYNLDQVHTVKEYITRDGGETFEKKFHYPESLDSKRLMIRYADDKDADGISGIQKDGIIELRRGVPDLSLGESRYSQVRILVDGTHYLKGMAVYSDNMPDGVDVVFNTNKKSDKSMKEVLKPIKSDPENPFGSLIKDADKGGQYWYEDPKTGEKKLGLINKRSDEGDWTEWQDALPSQFLGKQSLSLAKKQLDLAKADKKAEFDTICSLTNPTIKKYYLNKFAEECDSAAIHLKAAALPGQKYHVIVPINTLKDDEIYAPGYKDGTKLALVRYPHGGTFEIPILTVNNKNKLGRKIIGDKSIDAVGITSKVADRLSGADFDGDTVMCIPTHDRTGKVKIASTPPLKGLEGFDPKEAYGPDTYSGRTVRLMSKQYQQNQMGVVSNLITDMTLAGASQDELARAVRHSMVVIDAEKHKLDYKKSELDNDIPALCRKYQRKIQPDGTIKVGGASTILSRAKGEATVYKRQGTPHVNLKGHDDYDPTRPEGALIYKTADDVEYSYNKVNKRTGEVTKVTKYKTQKSTQMAETDDARTLMSDAKHPMERVYAEYANDMKALANRARVEVDRTGKIAYNRTAANTYKDEVNSLYFKLNNSLLNAPRERHAQRLANVAVAEKKELYKSEHGGEKMPSSEVKKASQQALTKYRTEVGAVSRRDRNIEITDKEWEAIQAGAISEHKLTQILDNADADKLRERAMPRQSKGLTPAQINMIKAMSNSNYSLSDIAKKFNVSTSTISKYLKGAM